MLYGQQQYATGLYGAQVVTYAPPRTDGKATLTSENEIAFNGLMLQTDAIIANYFDKDNPPRRDIRTAEIPRRSGAVILSDYRRIKKVRLRAVIEAESKSAMDTKLHELKKALKKQNGWLQFYDQGSPVCLRCTWTNENAFDRARFYNLTFADIDLEFQAFDPPYIQAENYSSTDLFGKTDMTLNEEIVAVGTSDEMRPVAILAFTAADSVTKIKMTNVTTGVSIESETIAVAAGDIIKFDAENLVVTKNGSEIDWSGDFLNLQSGVNSVKIELTGTSATYNVTFKHKEFYL